MENVWDYPRPPAVEPCPRHVRVELAGQVLAESHHALRVLETSHPPTIYVPLDDVREDLLVPSRQPSTRCEFKGAARYLDALISNQRYQAIGWMYPQPSPGYDALTDHLAFYPGRGDISLVGAVALERPCAGLRAVGVDRLCIGVREFCTPDVGPPFGATSVAPTGPVRAIALFCRPEPSERVLRRQGDRRGADTGRLGSASTAD